MCCNNLRSPDLALPPRTEDVIGFLLSDTVIPGTLLISGTRDDFAAPAVVPRMDEVR